MTDQEPEVPDVWAATMDEKRFTCRVKYREDGRGQFVITVTETGEVLHDETVGLAYGAIFGPDVSDVDTWQRKAVEVVDDWIAKNG